MPCGRINLRKWSRIRTRHPVNIYTLHSGDLLMMCSTILGMCLSAWLCRTGSVFPRSAVSAAAAPRRTCSAPMLAALCVCSLIVTEPVLSSMQWNPLMIQTPPSKPRPCRNGHQRNPHLQKRRTCQRRRSQEQTIQLRPRTRPLPIATGYPKLLNLQRGSRTRRK